MSNPFKSVSTTLRFGIMCLSLLLLTACVSIPEGIKPVNNFDMNRYIGRWYEIARLDHRFERGMQKVTADYSLRKDGGLDVINRGFLTKQQEWKEAKGKDYLIDQANQGHLKVSFFGPFYGSYIVFELDDEHDQYAFVTSTSRDYLWFLSRTPTVSPELMQTFKSTVTRLGFDTDKLIFTEHD